MTCDGGELMSMRLYDVALSSYLFSRVVDFDTSWTVLRTETNEAVDIRNVAHQRALLKWLNSWGCRQFARGQHDRAGAEIVAWFDADESCLPSPDAGILDCEDSALAAIGPAFDRLATRTASVRDNGVTATVGPVGAAKILFALRPKLLVPWDTPIRQHFGYDGSGASYVEHLRRIREALRNIEAECWSHGFEIADLPRRLGIPDTSLTQLVDKHYWITITRGIQIPPPAELQRWIAWA